jgi:ATP-binding cassette, subfamily B, bacterial
MTAFNASRPAKRPPVRPAPLETDDEPRYRPIAWPLVRRLLASLAPYKRMYAAAISMGLCHVTLDMLAPLFVAAIINFATDYTTGKSHVSYPGAVWRIIDILGLWTATFIASVILQRGTILYMTRAGENVQFSYRRRLFERLQILSMSYYDKTKLGRIISRCTSDMDSLREVNVWGIWQVVANATIMLVAAGMMLHTDWRLFLSVLAGHRFVSVQLGLPAQIRHFVSGRARGMDARQHEPGREHHRRARGDRVQPPGPQSFRVQRTAGRQHRQQRRGGAPQRHLSAAAGGDQVHRPRDHPVLRRLSGGDEPDGRRRRRGGRRLHVLGLVHEPDHHLRRVLQQLLQAMAGAERVFNLLDTQPDVCDAPTAIALPRITGHVEFEHVTFGYNPERPVLHDINFEARPGQMIALVGATGSGKSSIVSLIARFYQPQTGRVLVDGQDIRHVTGDSLHRRWAWSCRMNYLFTGTVMDNIRYARPRRRTSRSSPPPAPSAPTTPSCHCRTAIKPTSASAARICPWASAN